MDVLLGKVTQQAMNYAIRSGVTLTASYAIGQSAKLLKASPKSNIRDELFRLQKRLQHKIRIVSPAIDMIELIAARGNTSLESAVTLTKELRFEIQALGQRVAEAAAQSVEQDARNSKVNSAARERNELELHIIVDDVKKLLARIEDAVPLINLAITTSGATLSTKLPSSISPSRLLQASTFLTAGDTQYAASPHRAVQIGPTFMLTVYMLFAGHSRPENEEDMRDTTWKEVIHKARVKLRRVPLDVVLETGSGSDAIPSVEITATGAGSNAEEDSRIPANARIDEYAYQLMIVEDFDDDRVHDFSDQEAQPGRFDDVRLAGIREMIPIHEISKIFYADTSKVLNISPDSESHHPVLLLKRDVNAIPPRRMVEHDGHLTGLDDDDNDGEDLPDHEDYEDAQQNQSKEAYVEQDRAERNNDPWRLPKSLDPEWMAFEVYTEEPSSDTESGSDHETSTSNIETSLSHLNLSPTGSTPAKQSLHHSTSRSSQLATVPPPPWTNLIRTSLSLLELLLRLTSLQQFQQASHLSITDELLNFFLEESATTGAGGDESHRQAVRADARRRVGWDPYDESPLKRRGEQYQYQGGSSQYGGYGGYSREGTPMSPAPPQQGTRQSTTSTSTTPDSRPGSAYKPHNTNGNNAVDITSIYSPSPARDVQSKSMTQLDDGQYSYSPSPSPLAKGRTDFVKREGQDQSQTGRLGSPLRQGRRVNDEGLGTSPASNGTVR